VLDYARADSPARRAQLARMPSWRAPDWDAHFGVVDEVLGLLSRPRGRAVTLPAPRERQPALDLLRDETAP